MLVAESSWDSADDARVGEPDQVDALGAWKQSSDGSERKMAERVREQESRAEQSRADERRKGEEERRRGKECMR